MPESECRLPRTKFAFLLPLTLLLLCGTAAAEPPQEPPTKDPAPPTNDPPESRRGLHRQHLGIQSEHDCEEGPYWHKAHMLVRGNAHDDGKLIFCFRDKGRSPKAVMVYISDGMNEGVIAQEIALRLKREVGFDYQIMIHGRRNKVMIRREQRKPKFAFALLENSLPGVAIKVDYD